MSLYCFTQHDLQLYQFSYRSHNFVLLSSWIIHWLYSSSYFFFFSFLCWFSKIFWNNSIKTLHPSLSSIHPPICPSLLSFKPLASLYTNCYYMNTLIVIIWIHVLVYMYIPKYSLFSPYNATCIHVFKIDSDLWIKYICISLIIPQLIMIYNINMYACMCIWF